MSKKITLIAVMLLTAFLSRAAFVPVAVTGYNADVIANGAVSVAASTTADVDGAGYYFLDSSFTALGTPTYALPTTGLINSVTTTGLTFQMAGSGVNNSLRLATQGATGTLTVTTPQSAGVIYLMITSGSGTSTVDVTVTFTDATTQVFAGNSISDWYSGTPVAAQGFGRTSATALDMGGGTTNPRLYQLALSLNGANFFKQVASITITKTNATGTYPNVMGVSFMTTCTAPAAQPTTLVLNAASTSQITGSFTASSPAADQYLVVRYPAGATPVAPVNGTTYTTGSPLGTGLVVQSSTAVAFTASGLQGSTSYDFYVYAVTSSGTACAGPIYNVTAPLTGTKTTISCTGPSGTITVGPTGSYTTLTSALSSLSGGISGNVILELQSAYTSASETFPIIITSNNACYGPTRTVTIRPAAGANGLTISGANAGPTILFNGAQYVTIDGTPGGSSSSSTISVTAAGSTNASNLNIINTNTAGAAVMLDTQASNNKIKYCDLQGRNTVDANVPTAMAGVVYFGNSGTFGNDNNVVDHCNIHGTGAAAQPSVGIYALGATNAGVNVNFNDNDTISNCNIYDYFLATGNSAGVELNQGVNAWAITGNSFFQTSTLAPTAAGYNRGLWLIPDRTAGTSVGNGFSVLNNYFGGSAPLCVGTNPYTINSTLANVFEAMRLEVADATSGTANPTSIQGNTVANISVTATGQTGDPFHGIWASSRGNLNIGTVTGNTFGNLTGSTGAASGGISVAGGSGCSSHVIIIANGNSGTTPVVNIRKNQIGNIQASTANANISGIFVNQYANATIDSNTIGSPSAANSIASNYASSTSGGVVGINIPSGGSSSYALTVNITNNRVGNLSNFTASSGTQVIGIGISKGAVASYISVPSITGNTIKNLYDGGTYTGTLYSSELMGICMSSTYANACTISGNTVDSLVAGGNAAVNVTGIFFYGSASVSNLIAKNFVHSLDATGGSTSAVISGIYNYSGTSTLVNNMVRLGIKPDGTSITTPLIINGIYSASSNAANYFYFNSVYIGGTGVTATATNTFAFRRTVSYAYTIKDNIFSNVRSNATTGGNHYAIALNSTTLPICNYNAYQYSGTGGKFASIDGGSTPFVYYNYASPWITGDTNSVAGDPQFINPAGNAAAANLHISTSVSTVVEGKGTAIAGITDDIDGQTRSTLTPTDIGADAGNFIAVAPCTAPTGQPTALILTVVSATQINGSFTASVPAADGYLVVAYPTGTIPTAPVNATIYTAGGALGSGTIISAGSATTFSATGLTGNTSYTFYVYAYSANCINGPVYNTVTPLTGTATTTACSSTMSGVVSVGPTGTYPTLTSALAYLNTNGMGGAVTLELQSTYTSTSETFPITINNFGCLSAAHPLTIRPAAGANGLMISGSNAGPTVYLYGAKYVTIDGTPGGSSTSSAISVTTAGSTNATNLNIINTNAAGMAVKLDSQASNNRIKYCDLQGQNTTAANVPSSAAGVLYFGNLGANGNDNNLVDHCNIHSSGSGTTTPSIAVYSLGYDNQVSAISFVPQFNDNDTISNCNIYDYYSSGNAAGIEANYGNTAWAITGNSFFQTSSITISTSGAYNRAIWLIPYRANYGGEVGSGFLISGNYIGGSAPQCSGTPYTIASGSAGYFEGIRLELADIAIPLYTSSVQGNTIRNIFITTSTSSDPFHGITVTSGNGNVNIGTVTGNTIGTMTGTGGYTTGGITITGTGAVPNHMILLGGTYTLNIKNNGIGNILMTEAGSYFSGIFSNTAITANISNNTIGSPTTANSIYASNTGTTASRYINGIQVGSGAPVLTIANNTISNMSCNYLYSGSSASQVVGINIASTANVTGGITGNVIRNLYNAALSTAGTTSSAIIGISCASTVSTGNVVTGNIIDSLVSNAASGAVNVIGIYFAGTTSVMNTVSKNYIHSLSAASGSAILTGIYAGTAGTTNFVNNMIRLGVNPDGTSITTALPIYGIYCASNSSTSNNYYFNSVYIGGTGVGTTATNTYAFRRLGSYAYNIKDNIFSNVRSNATTGGIHYAFVLNSTTAPLSNYNVYQYTGTGGSFASTDGGTTPIAAYAAATPWVAGDTNSQAADPQFLNPAGTAATGDLHINPAATSTPVEGRGTAIVTVTDDYDGQLRSAYTPTDIGADAGFFGVPSCITAPTAPLNNSTICSGTITFSWPRAGATYDVYLNTGATATTIVSASQVDTFYTTTIVGGTYTWKVIPKNTAGSATGCSSFTFTAIAAPAISAQPQSQTVCKGTPVTMSVTATGAGITYQWQKNGTAITGATNATYNITAAGIADTGNYVVVINGTSPCNALNSSVAHLTVNRVDTTVAASGSTVFCTGGSVTLTSGAGSGTTYVWKQNGSAISGATTASYTASVTGNYRVVVTNAATGCVDSSAIIPVSGNTTPPATITPSGTGVFCQGDSLLLSANTGTGLSYQWKKAGVNIAGATNATYYATAAGSYTVSVSVGTGCTGLSTATVVSVNPLPSVTATAGSATTFCQGGSVTLNSTTATAYQWQQNAAAISGATLSTYTASSTGTYTVMVTDANGCKNISSGINVIVNTLPAATITPAGATTFCQGSSVVLNANTGTGLSYQWQSGGVNIVGQTNSSYTATGTGNYTVVVTNSNNCYATSAVTAVIVNAPPSAVITPTGPVAICQGSNVVLSASTGTGLTYQWLSGSANISGATASTYTVAAAGTYAVIVSSSSCSVTSAPVTVTVNALPAATVTASGPLVICANDSVVFTANSGTGLTYQWKNGTAAIVGATSVSYVAKNTGTYAVTVTNASGCSVTSAGSTVTVNPLPYTAITYTTPLEFCEGGAVVLNAYTATGYAYQWLLNGQPIANANNNYNITYQTGAYSVQITSSAGCVAVSQPVSVTVDPLPQPVVTKNGYTLSTGTFVTYRWYLNGNPITNGGNNASYTATQNGAYFVTVTDSNGCSNTSSVTYINNVGVKNIAPETVKIYPNPASGFVFIEAPAAVNVQLRDLSGKTVLTQQKATRIELKGIVPGIYMIYIYDGEGRLIKAEKLFKSE